jgi:alpha/beta superfamily hydrolase
MKKIITLLALTCSFANATPTTITTFDGQSLNADLMMPTSTPKAAILIIQGSGNVDLDGEVTSPMLGAPLPGQSGKLSLQIAESLAKAGIATLRFSKRGFDNPAQLANQTVPFILKDAKSAMTTLMANLPGLKYGVIGFSEGALIATMLADDINLDALYLMAPPTRSIDSILGYQFFQWPTKHLLGHLHAMNTESIDASVLSTNQALQIPLLGLPLSALDANKDGKLSVNDEILMAYQNFYFQIRGLLATPQYAGWYQSLKVLPEFSEFAANTKVKNIFIYQGLKDAQMSSSWMMEDAFAFPVKPTIHLYQGLGHCFSPMLGEYGEVKTTGPLSPSMLEQLALDASTLLN